MMQLVQISAHGNSFCTCFNTWHQQPNSSSFFLVLSAVLSLIKPVIKKDTSEFSMETMKCRALLSFAQQPLFSWEMVQQRANAAYEVFY